MKHMIKLLVLICFALPTTTNAQPLYYNSQFDLQQKFASYEGKIRGTYSPRLTARDHPSMSFISFTPSVKRTMRYKEEEDIPLRHTIDSVDEKNYVLIFPIYRVSNKVIVGMFPGGMEGVWQQPEGNILYMVVNQGNAIALMYDKHGDSRLATDAEVSAFYKEAMPNMDGYAAK